MFLEAFSTLAGIRLSYKVLNHSRYIPTTHYYLLFFFNFFLKSFFINELYVEFTFTVHLFPIYIKNKNYCTVSVDISPM